jgi:predicted N-acetyltransferase YhbS
VIIRTLQPADDRGSFSCGEPDYDDFLRRYAGQNQFRHRVGTTLVAVEDETVVGYATFAMGELEIDALPERVARGLPNYPMPVIRLVRLAVDAQFHGVGLGTELAAEVLAIAFRVREELGCVAVVVDALVERVGFYEQLGFEPVESVKGRPTVASTVPMVLPLADVAALAKE